MGKKRIMTSDESFEVRYFFALVDNVIETTDDLRLFRLKTFAAADTKNVLQKFSFSMPLCPIALNKYFGAMMSEKQNVLYIKRDVNNE